MKRHLIGIAAVERQTGLSAHTLRAWERRYGFPSPTRGEGSQRLYSPGQLAKLRLIADLLEHGHRPSNLVELPLAYLTEMAKELRSTRDAPPPSASGLHSYLPLLSARSTVDLRRRLQAALIVQGLRWFVLRTVLPLLVLIGEECARGDLRIEAGPLVAEVVERVLREAMAPLLPIAAPTVALTTFPSELHALGLLMVEALLRIEGATCIPLGTQMRPVQIANLVAETRADIVALSFSAAYADPAGAQLLSELRWRLPARIGIWAGGDCALAIGRSVAGVEMFAGIEECVSAVRRWRRRHLSERRVARPGD